MKKIKIIDLLNMRAKSKKIPLKIKYNGYEFQYDSKNECYCDKNDLMLEDHVNFFSKINDYIEIIEDRQIEKLGKIYDGFNDSYYDTCLLKIAQKVDEVIDAVNKLKVDGKD